MIIPRGCWLLVVVLGGLCRPTSNLPNIFIYRQQIFAEFRSKPVAKNTKGR